MDIENPIIVSQGPFSRLKELQTVLSGADIQAEIVAPPGANTNA